MDRLLFAQPDAHEDDRDDEQHAIKLDTIISRRPHRFRRGDLHGLWRDAEHTATGRRATAFAMLREHGLKPKCASWNN